MIGLGLIGGSIALALRERGLARHRRRRRRRPAPTRPLERGAIDAAGLDPTAEITFVAVPVLAVADQVKRALAETTGVVTDVGSVKAADRARRVDDPRFVGGHPMAGSELDGLDGADAAMFNGAIWVLTPVAAQRRRHVRPGRRPSSPSSAPRSSPSRPSATTRWSPSSATCRTSPRRR